MSTALTLAEQLVLLAHRGDTHKLQARTGSGTGSLDRAMQTALIVELIELGRVGVEQRRSGGDSFILRSLTAEPTGNLSLDALHRAIGDAKNTNKSLSGWLSPTIFAGTVVPDLCTRAIAVERYKTFGPFRRDYRLEPVDVALDAEIRATFDAVFYRDETATDRDLLFAALLADGFLWEYYAPLRNHDAQMAFLARVNTLADQRRTVSLTPVSGDGVAQVLTALRLTNSSSAT